MFRSFLGLWPHQIECQRRLADNIKMTYALFAGKPPQELQDLDRSKNTTVVDRIDLLQSLTVLPSTFAELADKVICCLPASTTVDFVTDTYSPNFIKMIERLCRRQSETFLLLGPNAKALRDWKKVLSNGQNKNQLTEWKKDHYAKINFPTV